MRTTILDIQKMKQRGERFAMVTAYDYTAARLADRAGIPLLLVGDSLGMVMLGHSTTVPVTINDMVHHAACVVRGSAKAMVVGDLPFLSYANADRAVDAAARLMQEAGVQAVKLEGGAAVAPIVRRLVDLGIPVMGHLGFTPQSVHQIGLRVQGRSVAAARQLMADAAALADAGAFAVVLELVPMSLAQAVTARLAVPTIGIGAGAGCDGQVQVWHDLLGLYDEMQPRHAKRYAELGKSIEAALRAYATEVRDGGFPTAANGSDMKAEDLAAALAATDGATT
ncbi:3-methyl-2-oxobutanoate hydroxymethyltransferase [Vineibacter terrae]|uniref:3-methyl-2-oxobutanoate hydroxymethyltransferase n=1 Tax=Vineibacter terrae TaxID=2586908 RepID=A0A5C8PWZ6_9HYPH|nr:3-methyl-2-oxobutanoate hydroxymethyltransferase [Vineibacter terrae]TXL82399.1 3-methyl-2-oxobutanoate hydroxymethyltransferase [Vineibacter terrae]